MITIKEEIYLTAKEAAQLMNFSAMTIRRYSKLGKIKKYIISYKKVYYKKSELENLFL